MGRFFTGPILRLGWDDEGRAVQPHAWIGGFEVQRLRNFLVVERQGGFDQRGNPGRLFQMSNIGFDRTEIATACGGVGVV